MFLKRLPYLGIFLISLLGLVGSSPLNAQGIAAWWTAAEGQFTFPVDIAINTNTGTSYVVDFSSHRVQVFDTNENLIATLGTSTPGFNDGQFYWPTAIELDSSGNIYVADLSGRIQVFNPALQLINQTVWFNSTHYGITDIEIGPNNKLYAVSPDSDTIRVYNLNSLVPEVGSSFPGGLKAVKITIAPDGTKFIVDDVNATYIVRIYDEYWNYVTSLGSTDSNPNYFWEFQAAPFLNILPDGHLYLSSHVNNRVWIMDETPFSDTVYGSLGDGTHGWGNNQLINPGGVAMAADGKTYVVDSVNRRIQVYNSDQTFSHIFGHDPDLQYQLADPAAVAVSPTGQLYVADTNHSRIQVYSTTTLSATYIDTIGASQPGTGNNQFDQPYDVAIAPDGRIFVVDSFNQRIQIFDTNHNYLGTLGTGIKGNAINQFNGPLGIDIDSSGTIYVADSYNHRIQIFDQSLNYLATIGTGAIGNGDYQFKRPADVAVGPGGRIFVVDTYNNRVQVYNPDLTYAATIGLGTAGPSNDQFNEPEGIDVDGAGHIFVADTNNNRVQLFKPDLTYSTTFGTQLPGRNETRLFQPLNVTVGNKNLYVADTSNSRIQVFSLIGYLSDAADDTYTIESGKTLTVSPPGVLSNDAIASPPLTPTLIKGPSHALTFTFYADGGFIYTPADGYIGQDSFTYQNKNNYALSNWAQVTINITEPETPIEETPTEETPIEETQPPDNETTIPLPDVTPTPDSTDATATPDPISTDEPEECLSPAESDPLLAPQNVNVIPNQGRPSITWQHDTNLEWINIWIGNAAGTIHYEWYPMNPADEFRDINLPEVICNCGKCSVLPDINPVAGRYQVWIQGWGKGSYATGGPLAEAPAWSGPNELRLPSIPPGPIIPTTPTITNGKLVFHWRGVANATWYNIWVGTGAPDWQPALYTWVVSNELNCINAEVCILEPGTLLFNGSAYDLKLPAGDYVWYIQSWGPGGYSTGGIEGWAEGLPFSVP